jgi:hypothetical protein
MMYTMSDFPALKEAVLGEGGLWPMIKKDLFQMADMPFYFDTINQPELGTGLNLSLVIVTMSTLETVATLANINGSIKGRDRNFATDVVEAYGERYFTRVNPRYLSQKGQSMVRLLWDAYRNGGLHRFLPKKHEFTSNTGKTSTVTFGVTWLENDLRPNRCCNLNEVKEIQAKDPTLAGLSLPHLRLTPGVDDSLNFWLCAQALVLELADSVVEWENELKSGSNFAKWFVDGVNAFEEGLTLAGGSGLAYLQKLITEVQR